MKKKSKKDKEDAGFAAFVRKHQVLLLIIVLAILIGPAVFFIVKSFVTQASQEQEVAPFAAVIDDFLSPPKKGDAGNKKPRGPILPIDTQQRKVDRLFFELPASLRPASPDAVAIIVWLTWREETVGKYDNGNPACIEWCDLTVLDRAQRIVLAQKRLRGGDPPKTLRSNLTKGVGPRPYKEIADYLVSLCQ